jgi:hypothetical protein
MAKVFGIGLNKTGTKTLGMCFSILGFKNKSYDLTLLESYHKGALQDIFEVTDQYDSFEDWPWPLIYRQLDFRYPDAKFILTIRISPEKWFESLCRHAVRTGPTVAREIAYGYQMPMENPGHHVDFYNNHNRSVMEYFKDRPDKLLIANWESEGNWELLCRFLNCSLVPDVPFPHENKSGI